MKTINYKSFRAICYIHSRNLTAFLVHDYLKFVINCYSIRITHTFDIQQKCVQFLVNQARCRYYIV